VVSSTGASEHTDRVRRYYDRTVVPFERLGQGGASIHRAVWGAGVSDRQGAHHHVDDLLLATVAEVIDAPRVVDLGCGLGASLLYLARHRAGLRGEGITISPAQAARATTLIERAGATERLRCREGNFLAVPDDLAGWADLTFSIEAFVHSPDADGYLQQAARTLRPGGRLVICDDFLVADRPPNSPRERRWLDEFRTGWRVGSLLTVAQVRDLAGAHGLEPVRDLDLTPALELRRPRDRWISAMVAVGRVARPAGDYWHSLVGGNALQRALIRGLLAYRFVELRRIA
jgi:SAM-dependent methyltransferase